MTLTFKAFTAAYIASSVSGHKATDTHWDPDEPVGHDILLWWLTVELYVTLLEN